MVHNKIFGPKHKREETFSQHTQRECDQIKEKKTDNDHTWRVCSTFRVPNIIARFVCLKDNNTALLKCS